MKRIAVIYWSGTGNTEMMAEAVAEGANINGNMVKLLKVEDATKEDVLNSDAVALGCPSMGAEELEEEYMEPFIESLEDVDFTDKPVALFCSYDWGAGEWIREWEERMKKYGAKLVDEGLIIQLTPDEKGLQTSKELGWKLAK